ncbi:acetylglutamate kinase [Cryobacterium mesophilum]|uniref:Acetylglutamate kinase n=2 Tax=Terrimesophilobacter mesophilus TaxID=433647 RepID=A0A4R8V849_9MICO|nr:acetylglutamate kinase [Terrimesophilobacter mesophilus]MBB5632119.1 acetylglutamate kinase [Terrimesophilobacter mesophilus]TFB78989.1 acetylglutamate kinase [Terrimesophilobacter mesophilus]
MTMTSWLESHRGETVIIKFGGNAMIDDELARAFCDDVVALGRAGIRAVITHGGGPQISSELIARGIRSEFRGGLRVTTSEAVHVVRDVLVRIGADLAAGLGAAGATASALAGDEHALFTAERAGTEVAGERVDLGQVGEITAVEPSAVLKVLDAGGIPVVSAIALGAGSELLNVNADAAAASLAVALDADWLILLTDIAGLYRDWPNRDSLVGEIDAAQLATLLPTLESGMIPKVAAALHAVQGGVGRAVIVDGRVPHVLLAEPFGASGTTITPAERVVS